MNGHDLILAVLGEARSAGVSLSKTKLLKLVYLVDLETCRSSGRIATGWDWKFHHFGPWTAEYDSSLEGLSGDGRVSITVLAGERDTQIIRSNDPSLDAWTIDVSEIRVATRRIVARWLSRDLPEILDYIYFESEPMQGAERGSRLSFESVVHVDYEPYRRESSSAPSAKIAELRRRLNLREMDTIDTEQRTPFRAVSFTPPKYDAAALDLLNTLEDD